MACDAGANHNIGRGLSVWFGQKKRLEAAKLTERLKTIREAFRVVIYIELKPKECKITYLLYTIYKLDSSVVTKLQKFNYFFIAFFSEKNKKTLIVFAIVNT